jgi:hypothetical protein
VGVLAAVLLAGPSGESPRSFPEIPRAFSGSLTVVRGAPEVPPGGDLRALTRRMLQSTETVWRRTFARAGLPSYRRAAFGGFVEDREARLCADRDEDLVGLYCPEDQRIFLRRADYERVGPAIWSYVVAHEVGHHVQQLRGTIPAVDDRTSDRPIDGKELSALVEAQADCYAGVWARATGASEDLVFAASHPRWFRRGRDEGRPGACHTFAGG